MPDNWNKTTQSGKVRSPGKRKAFTKSSTLQGETAPYGFRPTDTVQIHPVNDPTKSAEVQWQNIDSVIAENWNRKAKPDKFVKIFPTGSNWSDVEAALRSSALKSDLGSHEGNVSPERVTEFIKWATGPLVFEEPQHSVAHKALLSFDFRASYADGNVMDNFLKLGGEQLHSFLIKHDWAKLFAASDITGKSTEYLKLPYPFCCFEMQLSKTRVCMFALVFSDTTPAVRLCFRLATHWVSIKTSIIPYTDHWTVSNLDSIPLQIKPLTDKCYDQLRAVCAMLDAEIAEAEVIRAPYNRNAPPKGRNPLPEISHHIVSLAKRHRVAPRPEPHEKGTPKRLHFRRGHWRHYQTHKTWIKWQLVGNHNLGFVDKEYRL
jgi:hypothetical protein